MMPAVTYSAEGQAEWHLQNIEDNPKRYNRAKIVSPKWEKALKFGIAAGPDFDITWLKQLSYARVYQACDMVEKLVDKNCCKLLGPSLVT